MSELRFDPTRSIYSIIAEERARRLDDFNFSDNHSRYNDDTNCPFCKNNMTSDHYEIYRINKPNSDTWTLKVIPNRYPLFAVEGNVNRSGLGYYDTMQGVGAHEVIIDSDRHNDNLSDYTLEELTNLFTAYKFRIIDLIKDIRFKYLLGVKNIGLNAGSIINHPHSQLIAMPIIPDKIIKNLDTLKKHFLNKKRCLVCDILKQENHMNNRIVYENYDFIAITPYSSSAFEMHIYPKKHSSSFHTISEQMITQLSDIVKESFMRYSLVLNNPSLTLTIFSSPPREGRTDINNILEHSNMSYHWYIELKPIIMRYSSFENSTGIVLNPIKPEKSAKYLKEVITI